MTASIKDHPVYGAFFASTAAAGIIKNSQWYCNRLAMLDLGKTIVQHAKNMDAKKTQTLNKFIAINHLKIKSVIFLSKAFYPTLVGCAALYLDSKVSNEKPTAFSHTE